MKKYKVVYRVVKKEKLYGVKNRKTDKITIPCKFKNIEIYFDTYFDVQADKERKVINTKKQVIFNFKSDVLNRFENNGIVYRVLCIEYADFKTSLIYYGENLNDSVPENKQICKVIIDNNRVNIETMRNSDLEPFF